MSLLTKTRDREAIATSLGVEEESPFRFSPFSFTSFTIFHLFQFSFLFPGLSIAEQVPGFEELI